MTDQPSTEIEAAAPFALAATGELAQIQRALMKAMERIPTMETPQAAELWRSADIIARDLSILKRDASNRLCEIAPLVPYKYKGEDRMRPVKEQVIENVGVVTITQDGTRVWHDKQALAEDMIAVARNIYAAGHDGEMPPWKVIIAWVFYLFSVGDPRVTAMKEMALQSFDDEPWCTKTYDGHRTATVRG